MSARSEDLEKQPYELRPFGEGMPPNAADISALHAELLPRSPITLLGRRFREEFYYRELPALGLVFGAVAYVGGKPVGFGVATDDPDNFLMAAVRRKWPRIVWLLGTSLAGNPRRLAAIWEGMRIQYHRRSPPAARRQGEILSLGVLPEYRAQGGLSIARDLVLLLIERFRQKGIHRVVAVIDSDNVASLRFFHKLGFRPSRADVPGWRHASTEMAWEGEESQGGAS